MCLFMLEVVTVFEIVHNTQMHICTSCAQLEFGLLSFFVELLLMPQHI